VFECDGARIAYEIRGARRGVPLVLLRPVGSGAALWRPFVDALALAHELVIADPRGAGESTGRPLGSTRAMASDVVKLCEHLGLDRANVYGQSLGGMVATWVALESKKTRIERLVLASTSALGRDFIRATPSSLSFAACLARDAKSIEPCLAKRVLSEQFQKEQPDATRAIVARAERGAARRATLLAQSLAGATHDVRSRMGSLRASTLIIAGELDDVLGVAPQRALANAIRGARFVVLPNVGHDVALEAPERVASIVSEFVDGGEARQLSGS
jgi:3-oxoadipate enol-lactonase